MREGGERRKLGRKEGKRKGSEEGWCLPRLVCTIQGFAGRKTNTVGPGGSPWGYGDFVFRRSINQSINQSKHISIAPYVASESEAQIAKYCTTVQNCNFITQNILYLMGRKQDGHVGWDVISCWEGRPALP